MKKLLFILVLLPFLCDAQTWPIRYGSTDPSGAPSASATSLYFNTTTNTMFWWEPSPSSQWRKQPKAFDQISGCAAPAYTPTARQSTFAVNSCTPIPELYQWTGAAWACLNCAEEYTAGTGIDITGTEITNTAPDQTVTLSEGAGIDVTGTYPNFTVASTITQADGSETKINVGTGISKSGTGTTGNPYVLTNTGAAALSGVVNQLPHFGTATTITTESGSGANSLYWNPTTNKMSIGSTGGAGVLNVEYPGGFAFDRALEFTNSGGWTNRWIEMYAAATGSRGFSFGGQNNVGADVDNVLIISPWPSGRVAAHVDPSAAPLTYIFEVGKVSDIDGFVISRDGDRTNASMLNLNAAGDLLIRSKSGFTGIGDLDVAIGLQDPSAPLHLYGPSGATTDPFLRMEKSGGFGSAVMKIGYSGGEKFVYFSNGTTDILTLRSDNAETLTRVGINQTSPTSTIDISGPNGYSQARLRTSYTPTSSADALGSTGDTAWDANYFYIKTAAGWKRTALSTF